MKKYGFGVDIGGTTCKIGLLELSGTLIDKWEIKTNISLNGSSILSDVANEIEKKLSEKKMSKEEVLGIGVGVPGPVMENGVVNRCINLGWGVFNVETKLNELTGLKVKVANDANLAALGEMWKGGAKGTKNVVMITLGTGVGAGVIINGNIVPGSLGAAGEIGHIMVNENEKERCTCGKRGCLEQYASATGIVRMCKECITDDSGSVLREICNLTAKDVFDAAKGGDEFALSMVKRMGEILGSTLASIACVINPDSFVIGGGVSNAGQIIIDAIKENFDKQVFHACKNSKFVLAELGNDAGIYGGVRLVKECE